MIAAAETTLVAVPCPQCNQEEHRELWADSRITPDHAWDAYICTNPGYGQHYRIVKCTNCDLIYCTPRPPMDAITDSYAMVEDPLYLAERAGRELTFAKHLRTLEGYTGPAEGRRLLDVGAYIGVFVEEALKTGWDAWGVEPSRWASKYAQEQGLNVVQGTLDDVPFKPQSFDAITMWDVIEHVPDPKHMMARSYELLKPGGWVAVHTMDIDSLLAKIMGRRWPWLMEMHIVYFSRATLTTMLESVGFEVAGVPAQGRYLRLKYLTTRLRPYSGFLANVIEGTAGAVGLAEKAIPINFGDLVTAYAQKPE